MYREVDEDPYTALGLPRASWRTPAPAPVIVQPNIQQVSPSSSPQHAASVAPTAGQQQIVPAPAANPPGQQQTGQIPAANPTGQQQGAGVPPVVQQQPALTPANAQQMQAAIQASLQPPPMNPQQPPPQNVLQQGPQAGTSGGATATISGSVPLHAASRGVTSFSEGYVVLPFWFSFRMVALPSA